MAQAKWIIFGADAPGLEALVQACISLDLQPTLAGTHFSQVQTLAYRYRLEYHICDMFKRQDLDALLSDCKLVLNALSPYPISSQILVDACLRQHCHYLDLSSDVEQLATLSHRHQGAQTANSVLLPGLNPAVIAAQLALDMVSNDFEQLRRLDLGLAHAQAFNRSQSADFSLKQKRFIDFAHATHQCQHTPQLDLPKAYRPQLRHQFYTWSLSQSSLKGFIKRRRSKKQEPNFAPQLDVDNASLGPNRLQLWACAEDAQGQSLEAVVSLIDNENFLAEVLLMLVKTLTAHKLQPGFYRASQLLGLEQLLRSANLEARFSRSQSQFSQLKTPA